MKRTQRHRGKVVTRRKFMQTATGAAMFLPHWNRVELQNMAVDGAVIETPCVKYVLDTKGQNRAFIDKRSGRNYCVPGPQYTFLRLRKDARNIAPSKCSQSRGLLTLEFAEAGVKAVCRVETHVNYFTIEVMEVQGEGIEELSLSNLYLDISEHIGNVANIAWNENFATGVMALNMQTTAGGKSTERALLWSACYPKLGMTGAKVAVLACPVAELRSTIQEIVMCHGLIRSSVGGAWALDAEGNQYSYLFSYASESDIDDWISIARSGGFKEILISEIGPYGQYIPYPDRFPHGIAGVRTVVDKVHAAGLRAGWHMLSFTIQKTDPWVTPVADQRLAARSVLTLAEELSPDATFVPTLESPQNLPTRSGYWFRGGMDIQVGGEILVYSGLNTTPPFGLTGCQRDAYGTRAAAHSKSAALRNLQEVFSTYVPEAGSTMMKEMKERIASIINTCGFDMIYMDGLDGADVFEGREWAWHHGADFALSIIRQSLRPIQFEAAAWYHHDWHISSRFGAFDHPVRGQKRFVDYHVASNSRLGDLLPTQLGWWAFAPYQERVALGTKREDIEYLCAKCLGTNSALSLQDVTPELLKKQPTWPEFLAVMGDYERLRLSNKVPETVRSQLRQPGKEFSLSMAGEQWQIQPLDCSQHKVTAIDSRANVIRALNSMSEQPPRFRIQALLSAAPFDAPGNLVLEDFNSPEAFAVRNNQEGVSASFEISHDLPTGYGKTAATFRAQNVENARNQAWARVGRSFKPLFNMAQHPALGVWVLGDGKGEVLNFQPVDTRGSDAAVGEHYVIVDFTGWKYCELVEPEGARWSDYEWPYRNSLAACREIVDQSQVAELNLYFNNLPQGETAACRIGAIKALTVERVALARPRLTLAGKTLAFPVTLETGQYLELNSPDDCKLYDPNGVLLQQVRPEGTWPVFPTGENTFVFECEPIVGRRARAMVTTLLSGPPIFGRG